MKEDNLFAAVDALFDQEFGTKEKRHFLSYGRIEILGNHVDHQGGRCLVAPCDLSIKASVSLSDKVSIHSEGYDTFSFSVDDLAMKEEEKGTSLGLAKGVLAYLQKEGYAIGGFEAALTSDIYKGAGVSSSAAFEMFVGEVINACYNDGRIDRLIIAKAGQYAENVYFGKPSGLLDQCGSIFGGVSYVDFADPYNVKIKNCPFPSSWEVSIYLINPGASHAGANALYAAIPNDMSSAAKKVAGVSRLSEIKEDEFFQKAYQNGLLSLAEVDRATHYYDEVKRVDRAYSAIERKNLEWFLECERETEISQEGLLRNVLDGSNYVDSPLEAVHVANLHLKKGSARAMGGGFYGSVICFVPHDEEESFLKGLIARYGNDGVKKVSIPKLGAHEIK